MAKSVTLRTVAERLVAIKELPIAPPWAEAVLTQGTKAMPNSGHVNADLDRFFSSVRDEPSRVQVLIRNLLELTPNIKTVSGQLL